MNIYLNNKIIILLLFLQRVFTLVIVGEHSHIPMKVSQVGLMHTAVSVQIIPKNGLISIE